MNLPKFIPGLTVVVREEAQEDGTYDIYPDGIGMFVVSDAFLEHEEWHYQNYDGKLQFHEREVVGIINNGYYIPVERFQGVQEAPEHDPGVEAMEELVKSDPEEEAFIKEQLDKHLKEKKPKKIVVRDGDSQEDK